MPNFHDVWGEFKRAEFVYFVNKRGHLELDLYIIITEYVCIYLLICKSNLIFFPLMCFIF